MDSSEKNGLQEIGNQKFMATEDNINVLKSEDRVLQKSDSFVVDLEIFSNGLNKDANIKSTNSRFTLLRSLSRKAPQRGAPERNINDKDNNLSPSSSPKATQVISMPEKSSDLPQHQIIIKTGGLSPLADGKWGKRSSFKRSTTAWFSDPKRILMFFATLSSMGTILLIYFTLTTSNRSAKDVLLDWE